VRHEAKVVGRIQVDKTQLVFFDHLQLSDENYSDRQLMKFSAVGCRFTGCRFNNVWIKDASFGSGREMSEYIDCIFDGAKLNRAGGGYARFVRCSFRDVEFDNWICFGVELIDCLFSGKLNVGIFNGTPRPKERIFLRREHNEFHGNDFSGMELNDVAFRTGIDLTQQRLPSGPEYLFLPDAATTLKKAKVELENWQQDTELRRIALSMLKTSEQEVARGQRQLLLRENNYHSERALPRKAVDKYFAALRKSAITGTSERG
jgi:hypothetical protein